MSQYTVPQLKTSGTLRPQLKEEYINSNYYTDNKQQYRLAPNLQQYRIETEVKSQKQVPVEFVSPRQQISPSSQRVVYQTVQNPAQLEPLQTPEYVMVEQKPIIQQDYRQVETYRSERENPQKLLLQKQQLEFQRYKREYDYFIKDCCDDINRILKRFSEESEFYDNITEKIES